MEAGGPAPRVRVIWRLLAAFDVVLVAVFAVVAALDPYHVLEGQGVEIHNFQGLLPAPFPAAVSPGDGARPAATQR